MQSSIPTSGASPSPSPAQPRASDARNSSPGAEMRVEELARRAGVRVDTVRYYQSRGLLPPPRRSGRIALYGEEHIHCLERIRTLQAKGFTLATIARVLAGELDAADQALVSALAGEVLHSSGGELLELDDLAERTGVPVAILRAVEHEGLLVRRRVGDISGYTEDDVAVARAGLVLLEWGLPLPELLDLARRHDEAMRNVAERAVEMFDTYVRSDDARINDARSNDARSDGTDADEDRSDTEQRARRLVEAFEALLPATATLVSHHFTRVLLATALEHIEHVGSPTELRAVRESTSPRRSTVEDEENPEHDAHGEKVSKSVP
jgi:DNA-binding transcriptional MerR regulator